MTKPFHKTHVPTEVPGVGTVYFPKGMPAQAMKREAMRLHLIGKNRGKLPISQKPPVTMPDDDETQGAPSPDEYNFDQPTGKLRKK